MGVLVPDRAATYKRIAKVDLRIPPKVSAEARDLIASVSVCLPFSFSFLLLLSGANQLAWAPPQLLQYDPEKRLALTEVRKHPWIVRYRAKTPDPEVAE